LKLQLKLSDGKLVLQPLTGKLCDGELKASLSLAPQGKAAKADLEFSLVGCQTGELLAALGEDKIVEAPLEVQAGLAGSGESIAGIMAGLNGKLAVLLQQGKIDSRYLEVLGKILHRQER
ncbi:MAG: AsmA family protein, partial [Nitrospirota bacterium]